MRVLRRNQRATAVNFVVGTVLLFFVVLVFLRWASSAKPQPLRGSSSSSSSSDDSRQKNIEGNEKTLHHDGFEQSLLAERMKLRSEIERLQRALDEARGLGHSSRRRDDDVVTTTTPPQMSSPPSQTPCPTPLAPGDVPPTTTPSPPAVSVVVGQPQRAQFPSLWLIVGMPTIPRRDESVEALPQTALYRTVRSYLDQLAQLDGICDRVRIVVVNNRPGAHPVFNAVKGFVLRLHSDAFFGRAAKSILFFEEASAMTPSGGYKDAGESLAFADEFIGGSFHEPPTAQVRRQTLDVVRMLDHVLDSVDPSDYFLFTEDDFVLCPNGLLAMQYLLSKARWYMQHGANEPPFTALRCGVGLNGILLHNVDMDTHKKKMDTSRRRGTADETAGKGRGGDVSRFRKYLLRHYNRRPPDHLVVEFFAKESREAQEYFGTSRRVGAFRHNIFQHIGGRKSTLRDEDAWSMPPCFTELISPQVFEVEAWNPATCGHDDFWPCDSPAASSDKVVLRWNISRDSEVSKHWVKSGD